MTPNDSKKRPGLAVIIGLSPKGSKGAPPPMPRRGVAAKPADQDGALSNKEDLIESGGAAKATHDEAQVFHVENNCGVCDNYEPQLQACKVVNGRFEPTMGCIQYFEPKGTEASEGVPLPTDQVPGASPGGPETQEGAV